MGTVWTEILSENIASVWAWDDEACRLGVVTIPMRDYELTVQDIAAIQQYADDRETDLTVNQMYDESDFDGSVQEFVQERLATP